MLSPTYYRSRLMVARNGLSDVETLVRDYRMGHSAQTAGELIELIGKHVSMGLYLSDHRCDEELAADARRVRRRGS